MMMNCFAHNHMTCRQYGLWTRIRELQRKFGFVYFDADDLAEGFIKTSRDVIYDDCSALIKAGWFQLLTPRKRKKDGTYEARKINALTHKEWAVKNPDKCQELRTNHSANSDWDHSANSHAPVGNQRRTIRQIATHHSANSDEPVAPSQQRLGSKADMVQGRHESNTNMVHKAEGDSKRESVFCSDESTTTVPQSAVNDLRAAESLPNIQMPKIKGLPDGFVWNGREYVREVRQ